MTTIEDAVRHLPANSPQLAVILHNFAAAMWAAGLRQKLTVRDAKDDELCYLMAFRLAKSDSRFPGLVTDMLVGVTDAVVPNETFVEVVPT